MQTGILHPSPPTFKTKKWGFRHRRGPVVYSAGRSNFQGGLSSQLHFFVLGVSQKQKCVIHSQAGIYRKKKTVLHKIHLLHFIENIFIFYCKTLEAPEKRGAKSGAKRPAGQPGRAENETNRQETERRTAKCNSPGRACASSGFSGPKGRRFKSCHLDHDFDARCKNLASFFCACVTGRKRHEGRRGALWVHRVQK